MGKKVKFLEVSEDVQKLLDADMDNVSARRSAREAFKQVQLSIDHCLFKVWFSQINANIKLITYISLYFVVLSHQWRIQEFRSGYSESWLPCEEWYFRAEREIFFRIPYDGVKMKESYELNSRGLEIFSKSWLPETSPPKALVCFCHGYGDTCTFFVEGIARKLASSGYGVFAMDFAGFGLSEGLHGYIPSFNNLVDDVIEHYSKVKESPEFRTLPSFLFGQSMGGAVALKVHLKQPDSWTGAVLVAPMCKIADNMAPSWLLTQVLIGVAKVLPKQKLVPMNDFTAMAFRDKKKIPLATYNVIAYKDKPRLGTALELLRTTQEIENELQEVSLPFLILHGKADIVTDPSVSKALYEKARSSDKKLNLYDEAYHSLLEGEPDEMILRVLGDIILWLDDHTKSLPTHS